MACGGSIRYRVRYCDPNGEERSKSFATAREADDFAASVRHDLRRGAYVDPRAGRITFGQWAETWLPTKANLSPGSYARVEGIIRRNLAPWRDRPIAEIRRTDVQALVADLQKTKAPATVRKIYSYAGAIFRDAVADGIIASSPCQRINLPELVERPAEFLTAEQVEAIAAHTDERYRAAILVLGYCGLRPSELVGLRVDHLDMLRRKITIATTIVESGGRIHPPGPPKNRLVHGYTIPPHVADALAAHLAAWPPGEDGLIFPAPMGGPIRWSNFRDRVFLPAVEAADAETERAEDRVGRTHPYALRHTAASIMQSSGATLFEIGKRFGHRSQATTARYAHPYDARDEEIADGIDQVGRAARAAYVARRIRPIDGPSDVARLPDPGEDTL